MSTTAHLTPYERISDTVIRLIHGLDNNDATLLSSAFTPDAIQDLTSFSFLDPNFSILNGRSEILVGTLGAVGQMDTTHMLSNFQTKITGEGKASLTCYALAQHWRPGQGRAKIAGGSNFLMGNRYEGDLVLDGEVWRFEWFKINVVWTQGDFGVFDQSSWGVKEGGGE